MKETTTRRTFLNTVTAAAAATALPVHSLAQSVISRLEGADYDGHSLAMLNRIDAAMKQRIEIRFVPRKPRLQPV